jgi:hypothetical protein
MNCNYSERPTFKVVVIVVVVVVEEVVAEHKPVMLATILR